MYNMIANGVSPEQFGATGGGGNAGLLGMFGLFNRGVVGGLQTGMQVGDALTQYGARQRVAPFAEKNLISSLRTDTARTETGLIDQNSKMQQAFMQAYPDHPQTRAWRAALLNRQAGASVLGLDRIDPTEADVAGVQQGENYDDPTDYRANNAALGNWGG